MKAGRIRGFRVSPQPKLRKNVIDRFTLNLLWSATFVVENVVSVEQIQALK
jgi:hypothetical protein